ncbi:hypothetical protein LB505_012867 [Fusarium chuoi]|nr:hypothetical protein LB505_012867 [Fusarium chuoi]
MATSIAQSPGGHDHKPDDTARNEHIERALDTVESRPNDDAIFSKFPKMDKVDEFGAHAKTDPREIALVKKLDKYILSQATCSSTESSHLGTWLASVLLGLSSVW